jgi:hypothetical protein
VVLTQPTDSSLPINDIQYPRAVTKMDSHLEIQNLIARYSFLYDDGDLDGYADLFSKGSISGMTTHDEIVKFHLDQTYRYDGEPKTRHVIGNSAIDVDEENGTASSRSYAVIYQAVPGFPLQPILIGSYVDEFHRIEGRWWFKNREFEPHLRGDMSRHGRPRES